MNITGFFRELLFAGPRRLEDLAECVDYPRHKVKQLLHAAVRYGDIDHPRRGYYGLTAQGRAMVLKHATECDLCASAPPVGVLVFFTSDPVTVRFVCTDCAGTNPTPAFEA
jgi:hypothetical protein